MIGLSQTHDIRNCLETFAGVICNIMIWFSQWNLREQSASNYKVKNMEKQFKKIKHRLNPIIELLNQLFRNYNYEIWELMEEHVNRLTFFHMLSSPGFFTLTIKVTVFCSIYIKYFS